jgi:hypothetical protein
MVYVLPINCSFMMSQVDLVSCITEENKRRKGKRIILTKKFFYIRYATIYIRTQ